MPIPGFNLSNVLPPFVGAYPKERDGCSPYHASATDLVHRFATSSDRIALLRGLFSLRDHLSTLGFKSGFQWINGSFVEDVETTRGRSPGDIDLFTFANNPFVDQAALVATVKANLDVFHPGRAKAKFGCEHFFRDTSVRPELLVSDAVYWSGLFAHQRTTFLWKGFVQVPLISDDADALALL